jgi:hypothetical protein
VEARQIAINGGLSDMDRKSALSGEFSTLLRCSLVKGAVLLFYEYHCAGSSKPPKSVAIREIRQACGSNFTIYGWLILVDMKNPFDRLKWPGEESRLGRFAHTDRCFSGNPRALSR